MGFIRMDGHWIKGRGVVVMEEEKEERTEGEDPSSPLEPRSSPDIHFVSEPEADPSVSAPLSISHAVPSSSKLEEDEMGLLAEWIGHQLFAYVEALSRMRRDLLQAEEHCQDEVARLQAKTAEVATLREALERERQDREEERQAREEERRSLEESTRKAEAEVTHLAEQTSSTIQRLRKEVLHLMKKLKKSEDELRKSKKCYSEAAAEVAHFRSLQVKAIMDYSRRKANFTKELEESQDEQKWSQKVSDLQKQLQDAEMSHDVQRASWRRQVEEHKGRFRQAADEVVRLQRQLVTRAQLANAQDTKELLALRGTVEGIFVSLGEKTAELQQVKIQLALERKAIADAEAESEVLRKRCREAEAESRHLQLESESSQDLENDDEMAMIT
uniref:Trichoplein keratin filament-binding protein-like n=1 Tax=Elaeis guineensis var. tenera TaxID=51953 RepID=A0A6I9RIR9_ELAGV|nr:trichoplein keratin filament-binding protein-like [Elaeis guineensis]